MKIHFIGIGGIGVSALAQYYLKKGHQVSGSDLVSSDITESLQNQGAKIFTGPHKIENLICSGPGIEQVIYSQAILEDNPELKRAKEVGIKCLSYPEALGELTKKYFTIAIAGAHGKGTTAAMISLILIKAGLDPTVIIGTKLKEFVNDIFPTAVKKVSYGKGSNCRVGESQYLIIEADEYKEAFLNYWPKIIVLTNIDREHLDYYKDLDHIIETFGKFIRHLPGDGVLIANKDNENIRRLICNNFSTAVKKLLHYSLRQKEAKKIKEILKIPGEHNVSNALAALSVARVLRIPDKASFEALGEYKGAWRRFEIHTCTLKWPIGHFKTKEMTIVSDYAHHPTEIEATLKAIKEKFPKKEIWCVFQPHQYQRTYYLFNDFVKVFREAPIERAIITDIYQVAGREDEEIKERVSSRKLVKAINKPSVVYLAKEKIKNYLKENLKENFVLLIMGAGDIYKLVDNLGCKNKKKVIN